MPWIIKDVAHGFSMGCNILAQRKLFRKNRVPSRVNCD